LGMQIAANIPQLLLWYLHCCTHTWNRFLRILPLWALCSFLVLCTDAPLMTEGSLTQQNICYTYNTHDWRRRTDRLNSFVMRITSRNSFLLCQDAQLQLP
jgi:hypothetical protein